MIFVKASASDPVQFSFREEVTQAEQRLLEFKFWDAPLDAMREYTFAGRVRSGTSYEGTFLVDPKTFDVVRLTIWTKGLPPVTGACEADTSLDYQNVWINGTTQRLPLQSRLLVVNTNGSGHVNQTVFSDCREFVGESKLSFGSAADANGLSASVPAAEQFSAPKGCRSM